MTGDRTSVLDLGRRVSTGAPVGPGLPSPSIDALWSREMLSGFTGISWEMPHTDLVGIVGSYLITPRFYDAAGVDLADFELGALLALPIVLVPAGCAGTELPSRSSLKGKAILFRSTPGSDQPTLSAGMVEHLIAAEVGLVGTDADQLDGPEDEPAAGPALSAAGIPQLVAAVQFDRLARHTGPAELYVLPSAISGIGAFPVRPLAKLL